MPIWFLLLGAGGIYWWWKQQQQAPAAPQLPPAPPPPTMTSGFNLVPDVVGPPTYGLTPNAVDELVSYGEYSNPHHTQITMGYAPARRAPAYSLAMPAVYPGDAQLLPDGTSDNGLAAQAAVAAMAVPPSALPLTAVDWPGLLSTAASIATIVTVVGAQPGGGPTPAESDMIRWAANSAGSQHVADMLAKFSHYPQAREVLSRRYSYLRSKGL